MGKILDIDNFFIQKRKDPPYPPHQKGEMLEYQFYNYFIKNKENISDNYIYIPILWTNLYANFRTKKDIVHNLVKSNVLPLINPNKKYFTIVQSANGIEMGLPKNILVFSQGGVGDVALPLISTPYNDYNESIKKDIFASFIGRDTHECRKILFNNFSSKEGYLINLIGNISTQITKNHQMNYKEVMSKSIFSLAPRGFGPTSFRLYECMWYDSIPVYIYDKPWLPYEEEIDWESFSVLIEIKNLNNLDKILCDTKIEDKLNNLRNIRNKYFTYESTIKKIIEKINCYDNIRK